MRPLSRMISLALLSMSLLVVPAHAWIRSPATTFATLPAGATTPTQRRCFARFVGGCRRCRSIRSIEPCSF